VVEHTQATNLTPPAGTWLNTRGDVVEHTGVTWLNTRGDVVEHTPSPMKNGLLGIS
jgi:hypothetical protein